MKKLLSAKPAQPNQSVERAITCLYELAAAGYPMTCKEMAERLGCERTKAGRTLGTLASMGFASRLSDLSYIPGAGVHALAAMSLRGSSLLNVALPHIFRMKERWGLTGALGVLWRDKICYLYHSGGDKAVEDAIACHEPLPAWKSVLGKSILAGGGDERISEIARGRISPEDFKTLQRDLKSIREYGYFLEGTHSIAIALGAPTAAAIAFQGKWKEADSGRVVSETQEIARRISESMEQALKKKSVHRT